MRAKKTAPPKSVFHFYFRVDEDSVPPPGSETGVMLFALGLLLLGEFSLLIAGNFVGAGLLTLLCPIALSIPGRLRLSSSGLERRSLLGRARSFNGRKKTLWGRSCTWQEVTRFDDKETNYRPWLRERLGDRKLVLRAKGMPTMEVHSRAPVYDLALQWAKEQLPPELLARSSLIDRVQSLLTGRPEDPIPKARARKAK